MAGLMHFGGLPDLGGAAAKAVDTRRLSQTPTRRRGAIKVIVCCSNSNQDREVLIRFGSDTPGIPVGPEENPAGGLN